jgi:hypothetical protein
MKLIVSDADPFDAGSATPNDPTKWDLQGGLEHELGHAARGWLQCTDGTNAWDCAGGHFDSTHNGAICDDSDLAAWSTTCWKYPSKATSWRIRSLETRHGHNGGCLLGGSRGTVHHS